MTFQLVTMMTFVSNAAAALHSGGEELRAKDVKRSDKKGKEEQFKRVETGGGEVWRCGRGRRQRVEGESEFKTKFHS